MLRGVENGGKREKGKQRKDTRRLMGIHVVADVEVFCRGLMRKAQARNTEAGIFIAFRLCLSNQLYYSATSRNSTEHVTLTHTYTHTQTVDTHIQTSLVGISNLMLNRTRNRQASALKLFLLRGNLFGKRNFPHYSSRPCTVCLMKYCNSSRTYASTLGTALHKMLLLECVRQVYRIKEN